MGQWRYRLQSFVTEKPGFGRISKRLHRALPDSRKRDNENDPKGESLMKKFILALGVAGLMAAPALAQTPDFASVDADGNTMVSLEESTAAGLPWTAEQFAAADTNGDGSLSAEEFAAAIAQ